MEHDAAFIDRLAAGIPDLDVQLRTPVLQALDCKTKPRESLGRLEVLAVSLAIMQGRLEPCAHEKAIVVMGGDHGIARAGVSAYPSEVTAQMMLNFARGGAAINVFARQVGARVRLVDMGVASDLPSHPHIDVRKIGYGTADVTLGPAMTVPETVAALLAGVDLANELADEHTDIIALGEMGIGNTTAATLLAAHFADLDPMQIVGRGTGIDSLGLDRKRRAIAQAIECNAARARTSSLDALACYGGFEIAGLAGVALGAAARKIPVVVDGFITAAAVLAATKIAPKVASRLLASHNSVEPGHAKILEHLALEPLFDLRLRLGEGTGAALALPMFEAATRMLAEMATFESAAVSDSGA